MTKAGNPIARAIRSVTNRSESMEAPVCWQPLIASQFLRPRKQLLGAVMVTNLRNDRSFLWAYVLHLACVYSDYCVRLISILLCCSLFSSIEHAASSEINCMAPSVNYYTIDRFLRQQRIILNRLISTLIRSMVVRSFDGYIVRTQINNFH